MSMLSKHVVGEEDIVAAPNETALKVRFRSTINVPKLDADHIWPISRPWELLHTKQPECDISRRKDDINCRNAAGA